MHDPAMSYLSGRIDNLRCEILAIVLDDAAEGVLNGGIITLYEVALDEADRERRLAWGY